MITSLQTFTFVIFPYIAIFVCIFVSLYRYYANRFSFSSISSQFLESEKLFWGSMPFHYGIIIILTGHIIGFLFPKSVTVFNGIPLRLYILEGSALAFGLSVLLGLFILLWRRITTRRIVVITTPMDIIVLLLLIVSTITGLYTAFFYRWGSYWYVHSAVPYLKSIFLFKPQPEYIIGFPLWAQLHFFNFFLLLLVFPFSRLVHIVSLPLPYIWRSYQLVRWYKYNKQQG